MNSVIEIGENIILQHGIKEWEGSSTDIFKTEKSRNGFCLLFKKVRQAYLMEDKE